MEASGASITAAAAVDDAAGDNNAAPTTLIDRKTATAPAPEEPQQQEEEEETEVAEEICPEEAKTLDAHPENVAEDRGDKGSPGPMEEKAAVAAAEDDPAPNNSTEDLEADADAGADADADTETEEDDDVDIDDDLGDDDETTASPPTPVGDVASSGDNQETHEPPPPPAEETAEEREETAEDTTETAAETAEEEDGGADTEEDDDDDDDDDAEHELVDASESSPPLRLSAGSGNGNGSVALPTMTYPVNEMEVVTNRGGRSGSLSKFLDDADLYRRRSLTAYGDDPLGLQHKTLTLEAFLGMAIDPILEVLDDTDSDVRLWLMQPDTVEAVLREFVRPPVFSGEPHEEYGYYKTYFVCSEVIMKLYTGEEDLYESFSSDSSSGSGCVSAVFGCQDSEDLGKWALLYSIFDNPGPLDEMQLLFFSKALVRLHDGFCLEDGYVTNVLRRFLPTVIPHLYSNTIKYMLTLILQSYESVHPITGRNDAMEILVPILADATRIDPTKPLNPPAIENASYLIVDMLQANQADRLGAFCRREGGVYLSKYFVRDQFGTIRGFESMTHGYHNFLQFMLLEELSKWPIVVEELFENALHELEEIRAKRLDGVSGCMNVHITTELLLLCRKHGLDAGSFSGSDVDGSTMDTGGPQQQTPSYGFSGGANGDGYASSPRHSSIETAMYQLGTLTRGDDLWSNVLDVARGTARRFCGLLNAGLPSSVEIALAKHLHALVHLGDEDVDRELHLGALVGQYLRAMAARPSFDMLLIHVVPAIAFVLRDSDGTRSRDNPLTHDFFTSDTSPTTTLPQLLIRSEDDIPALKIYAGLIKDVIDEVLAIKTPSANNATLQRICKHCPPWGTPPKHLKPPRSPPAELPVPVVVAQEETAESPSTEPETSSVESLRRSGSDPTANRRSSLSSQKARSSSHRAEQSSPVDTRSSSPSSSPEAQAEPDRDSGRKSSHYIKQMLQTPVFRGSMRLGSVIRPPEKSPSSSEDASSPSERSSFGWNSMLKRLRKSLVAGHSEKSNEKKVLAIANEPYVPPSVQAAKTEVLVVDVSKGDDVTKFVHRDGGVHVADVAPSPGSHPPGPMNVLCSGYMYRSKFPETGQRHVWERYYFQLNRQECALRYYVSEAHAKDRTYVRGTVRPVMVTEGIPVSASGQHAVYGFQITTQGHGAFMVVVDSIDSRLVWLTEILAAVSLANPHPAPKRLSLVGDNDGAMRAAAAAAAAAAASGGVRASWNKQQLKELVVDFYKNLFGPNLRFSTPMDAPASFWMEEKIDPVAEACVLSSNLPNCVPYWGEFHGYKRMCEFWKIRDETIERSSGRVLRIVVDEDEETAVVMTSTTYRILRNSEVVTEESCDILNISNGAIISLHCTFDSYRVAEAFRKEGISAS